MAAEMNGADPALDRLVDAVRDAAARQQPLRIVGGGSKDFLGGPLVGEPLDVRPLRGISSYEPTELVVTVRGGTPLAELEAALAEKGQCLAFEPPRFGAVAAAAGDAGTAASVAAVNADTAPEAVSLGGTVGGMVAAGLAGPSRAAVGAVRDFVLGATLLNGRGEVLSFGGQVMKNVAGYDVSRLLAGSMGVLGVICEVSLKVLPVAPATLTLRFDLDQTTALRRLNDWAGQPLPVNASAWWDGALVLRLRGARAAVASAGQRLGGDVIPDALAEGFWTGLRDQHDEFFAAAEQAVATGATLWRLSVASTAPRIGLAGELLVEWGGAQRWLVTDAPAATVQAAAAEARGHASVFRSADPARTHTTAALSAPLLRIHQAVKTAFDPAGLFNRQRLLPSM